MSMSDEWDEDDGGINCQSISKIINEYGDSKERWNRQKEMKEEKKPVPMEADNEENVSLIDSD